MRLRFDLGCHFSFVQVHNIFCSLISVLISGAISGTRICFPILMVIPPFVGLNIWKPVSAVWLFKLVWREISVDVQLVTARKKLYKSTRAKFLKLSTDNVHVFLFWSAERQRFVIVLVSLRLIYWCTWSVDLFFSSSF